MVGTPVVDKYQENTTPGASFVTSSWTPNVSARLYFAWLLPAAASGTVSAPTAVTGNSLTWEKVLDTQAADSASKLGSLWAAYGTGTAGALTVTMGASHTSCIVTVVEVSGPTSLAAILQKVSGDVGRNYNQKTLSIPLADFAAATNAALGFFGIKAPGSGGNTAISPGAGFTELLEDRIDATRQVYVEYQLTPNKAVALTLTGATGEVYTAHHIWGVAVELGSLAQVVVHIEALIDIDPDTLPGGDDEGPPIIEVQPAADAQATGARPRAGRNADLGATVARLERTVASQQGQINAGMGFAPTLDVDPVDPPDGAQWIRSTTGEFCWRIGGVTQVLPASTPITPPDRD